MWNLWYNIFVEWFDESKHLQRILFMEKIIVGVDEAGRGPLAGRVYAAAVILGERGMTIEWLNDSKQLSRSPREIRFGPSDIHGAAETTAQQSANTEQTANLVKRETIMIILPIRGLIVWSMGLP